MSAMYYKSLLCIFTFSMRLLQFLIFSNMHISSLRNINFGSSCDTIEERETNCNYYKPYNYNIKHLIYTQQTLRVFKKHYLLSFHGFLNVK